MSRKIKPEHNGAKNGGGYHGKREEAKKISNTKRRKNNSTEINKQLSGIKKPQEKSYGKT